MQTIQQLFKGQTLTEELLIEKGKEIHSLGSLKEIEQRVSKEVFGLYIAVSVIGNWREDGWWGVFTEQPQFVPYIAESFETFDLHFLKKQFEELLQLFPEDTPFKKNDTYYRDILIALQDVNAESYHEQLQQLDTEQHEQLVNHVKEELKALEQLTDPLFGDEDDRWDIVFEFIKKHQ